MSLLISGCATPPLTRALLHDSASLPAQAELQQVPFFPQDKYQCGPAALATVLHHQDGVTQPDDLVSKVYIPEKNGSVPLELIVAARSYQRIVYPLAPSLEDLLAEVSAGHPVLVMQNLGFNWLPQWHYAVLVGYDLAQRTVTLRSATVKRRVLPLHTFERTWRRANHWALVILPPNQIPVSAQPLRYLKAAQDLEATGHLASAIEAYQAAAKNWPDNILPGLALGNAYYAQRAYPDAEQVFRQALGRQPHAGELWNNLAYTLLAQGCSSQALSAVLCATQQEPDSEQYQQSLAEIRRLTAIDPANRAQCPAVSCSP